MSHRLMMEDSTQDLVQTLDDLHSWKVSVLAQMELTFDLSTTSGKLMRPPPM